MAEILNTDIYNVADVLNDVAKKYTGEDEETLAVGIYGYFLALTAKSIKSSIAANSELYREAMYGKAKYERDLIIHAIQQEVPNIRATPARAMVTIGLIKDQVESLLNENNEFIFDCNFEYEIEGFPFRLDYDIALTKTDSVRNEDLFTAMYIINHQNALSDVTSPILNAPYVEDINTEKYIFIQTTLRQVHLTEIPKKILTNNVIENKTMQVSFEDQLAEMTIRVVTGTGEVIWLTPIFEGQSTRDTYKYCYYTYLTANTIRIKFDPSSYMPPLNSEIIVSLYTTKGKAGVFDYLDKIYFRANSETYGYDNVDERVELLQATYNGIDRYGKEELSNTIPEKIIEKRAIIMEADIDNWFDRINCNEFSVTNKKRIHNANSHYYYSYALAKTANDNLIQTNTKTLKLGIKDVDSTFGDGSTDLKECYTLCTPRVDSINDTYAIVPFIIHILTKPLCCFYYFPIVDLETYLNYNYINPVTSIHYIANRAHFYRELNHLGKLVESEVPPKEDTGEESTEDTTDELPTELLTENFYLDMNLAQSINAESELSYLDTETKEYVHKLRIFLILYYNSTPQCYLEGNIVSFDETEFTYSIQFNIKTNNKLNTQGMIALTNVYPSGSEEILDEYYISPKCLARVYIVGEFENALGRYDLDNVIPGLEKYSVCNAYTLKEEIEFINDYTDLIKTDIFPRFNGEFLHHFEVPKVPVLEQNVFDIDDLNNTGIKEFAKNLVKFMDHFEEIELLTENSFEPNLKFYNTSGPSEMYYTDVAFQHRLEDLSLEVELNLNLVSQKDLYLKDTITEEFKMRLEKLARDKQPIHFNNICSEIRRDYGELVNYVEVKSCNGKEISHIYLDDTADVFLTPEYISIKNYKDENGIILPCINVNIV